MYEDEVMDVNAAEPVYQDETLVCKECGKEFVFTAGEHASMRRKASRTSPRPAERAAMRARTARKRLKSPVTRQSVPSAVPLHG